MAAPQTVPVFRRLFPPQQWRSGRGVAIVAWSIVAALLLASAVAAAALLVDLLVHRGQVSVGIADAPALRGVVAETRHTVSQAPSAGITRDDTGILPTVWRARNRWWGPALTALYQHIPPLQQNTRALLSLAMLLLLVGVARVFSVSHLRMLAEKLATESASALRRSIHRQVLRLGPSDLSGADQSLAVELFTEATSTARRSLARWLSGIIRLPLELALILMIAFFADWRLALQCGLPLGLIGWVTLDERRRGAEYRRRFDAEAESDLRPLADGLRKTRLVRGYGMEEFEHTQFQTHLQRYTMLMLRGGMGETWAMRTARFFLVALVIVITVILGMRVLTPESPLPLAIAWLIVSSLAALAVVVIALRDLWTERQSAALAAEHVYRYLAKVPEVSQAVGAKFLNPVAQSVILEAVTYRRDGKPLLERVDLRIPAKSMTALVSNEPLSARAIAFMLPRFIEPDSGRILFDSEDIAWATLESLRAEAIYASADDPFFTGTVLENLICGESRFTSQEAIDACKLTHAHKFISALPNGYETQLGEHGEQLSPGQSFRLGLARAILRNPAVLIIEEPSARLDDDSKALVDDAYTRILKNRTVFVLPTRLSTVKLCQQIVFLSGGQVETVGPHAELVRSCEGFRHWEYVHFSQLARSLG